MPSPLQPFTGKRGLSSVDGSDAYSTKRACGGFRPAFDIENLACTQMQAGFPSHAISAAGFCFQQGQPQPFHAQAGHHYAHSPLQQITPQSQQHGQQRAAGDCMTMDYADMSSGDGMEMDGNGLQGPSRYERFPSKQMGSVSPTHYHKSTAIGYIPQLQSGGAVCGAEECMVRTWECEYMGKNDYY